MLSAVVVLKVVLGVVSDINIDLDRTIVLAEDSIEILVGDVGEIGAVR
jgi:hypothetical protein